MENICDVDDPFNRYKYPTPVIQYQKQFTIIVNLDNIASHLHRTPEMLKKFLSQTLNTRVGDKINGHFSLADIKTHIRAFIDLYVLCPRCGLPETTLKKDRSKCKACGDRRHLPEDKLTKWLSK